MEIEPTQYDYRVRWSADEGEFIATVAEFPLLSWLDVDQVDALRGLVAVVAETVDDLQVSGERVPEPIHR